MQARFTLESHLQVYFLRFIIHVFTWRRRWMWLYHIEPSQWRHQTLLSPSFRALIYAQNSKVWNDVLGGEDIFPPPQNHNKENRIGWPDSRRRPQASHRWFPISTIRPAAALVGLLLLQQLLQRNSPASRSEQKAAAEEWSSIFIAPERSSRGINRTHPSLQGYRATVVTSHIYSDGKTGTAGFI